MKNWVKKDIFWLLLVVFLSLLAIAPLFKNGFYPFHDESHIANLYEMIRAISSGQIPPRWAPDFSFNYGHPFFVFYYPLPFYLGAFFYLVFGLSLIWSLKLVFLFSLPLSGIAFYYLMKKFFNQITACAGAVIYLFTPYRAVDLYVRGAVGELWSFVFMPLVLLTLLALAEKRTLKNIFYCGLALAGLILAHNLTPLIFLPFALFFVLAFIYKRGNVKSAFPFVSVVLGVLSGLTMSSFYWLPLIIEKKYLQSGTPFNPIDHFPFIKQLILPSWGYGASVWGPGDGMSFQIGLVNLTAIIIAALVCFKRDFIKEQKRLLFSTIICFFMAVFLMNIRTYFLWKLLPLGDYVQFPWRLLIITTFFSSFAVGFSEKFTVGKLKTLLPLGLAFFSIVLTQSYFKPQKTINVDDNYYLNRFFANITTKGKTNIVSSEYLNYSEDYLPLTIWTKERPLKMPEEKITISKGKIVYQEQSPINYSVSTEANQSSVINFNAYFFPGWKVKVDKKEISIAPSTNFGNIIFSVPNGEHEIDISFGRTPIRLFAEIVSLTSLLVMSALVFLGLSPRR